MCPANLARRASERTPASDPACEPRRAVPPCELPLRTPASGPTLRTAPASPGERSHLAIPLANPSERSRHPCHQRIGSLSALISIHRTSRFSLALGATKCSRSTLPASDSDQISPWCVPRRRSVAVFTSCVFNGPRMGKESLPGNLSQLRVFGLPAMARFLPLRAPERSAMAKCSRNAFPGVRQWQDIAPMRSRRGLGRKKCQFVARYCRHAFKMSWFWQDLRAMHLKIAAKRRSGMHHAKILP